MKQHTHNCIKGLAPYESTQGILSIDNTTQKFRFFNSSGGLVLFVGTHACEKKDKNLLRMCQQNPRTGFSLIELMVSLTLFSIVMTVSLGTLLTLIDANTKAQALSSSMTNISFALDSISRNLRTGKDFHCADTSASVDANSDDRLHSVALTNLKGCNGGEAIIFTPGLDSEVRVGYRINGAQIEQWVDEKFFDDEWIPITSDEPPGAVTINTFSLSVVGEESVSGGDEIQPQISILIDGEVDAGLTEPTVFRIQTNVTQRILNY